MSVHPPTLQPLEPRRLFAVTIDPGVPSANLVRSVFEANETYGYDISYNSNGETAVAYLSSRTAGVLVDRFSAAGVKLGDTITATTDPSAGVHAIALADDGTFFVGWRKFSESGVTDLLAQRFDASLTPVGNTITLATLIGEGVATKMDLAVSGDGQKLIVAFSNGRSTEEAPTRIAVRSFSTDTTAPFSDPVTIATGTGVEDTRLSLLSLRADLDGDFAVLYTQAVPDTGGSALFLRTFTPSSSPRSDTLALETKTRAAALDVGPNGDVFVASVAISPDDLDFNLNTVRRFTIDGAPIGSNIALTAPVATSEVNYVDVAAKSDGSFVALYPVIGQEVEGIEAFLPALAEFTSNGTPDGAPIKAQISGYNATQIILSDLGQGMLLQQAPIGRLAERSLTAKPFSSRPILPPSTLPTGVNVSGPEVALLPLSQVPSGSFLGSGDINYAANSNGEFLIGYKAPANAPSAVGRPVVLRYNAAGQLIGNQIVVSDSVTAGTPSLALNDDGSFVAVYSRRDTPDSNALYVQRFDATGNPLGSEITVDTLRYTFEFRSDYPTLGRVTIAPTGDFAISYIADSVDDEFGSAVYLRTYSFATGEPTSAIITVDQVPEFRAIGQPQVRSDASGNLFVLWQTPPNAAGVSTHFLKGFTSNGTPRTPVITVGTDFVNARLDVNPAGQVLIVGNFRTAIDKKSVTAQKYSSTLSPIGQPVSIAARRFTDAVLKSDGSYVLSLISADTNKGVLAEFSPDGGARGPAVFFNFGTADADVTRIIASRAGTGFGLREFTNDPSLPLVAAIPFSSTPLPPPIPAAATALVTTLAASASGQPNPFSVTLTWTDNASNESGFRVFRSTDGTTFTKIADLDADVSTYTDPSVPAGADYTYRITAFNAGGDSAPASSTPITAITHPALATPVIAGTIENPSAVLTWTDASSNETGFRVIQIAPGPQQTLATLPAGTTTYTVPGLTPGTTHRFTVIAFNPTGESQPSAFQEITPVLGPRITLTAPSTFVAGTKTSPILASLLNASGQRDTTDRSKVTLALISAPAGIRLSSTSATPKAGLATFKALSLTRAGSYTYRLTSARTGVYPTREFTVTVTPAALSRIAFSQSPSTSPASSPFSIAVRLTDRYGNLVTAPTTVTLALGSRPKNASPLTGTLTTPSADGTATFSDLTLSTNGNYTLLATAAGKKATSKRISVK